MFCYGSRMPDALEAVIDESGDAGTGGKGTRWLVIALVLDEGEPGELATLLHRIKAEHAKAKQALHFTEMRNVRRKLDAYQQLAEAPITAIVVAIDTWSIHLDHIYARSRQLYRYGMMLALERASEIAAASSRRLVVTVESSSLSDIRELRQALQGPSLERRASWPRMRWDAIGAAEIKSATKSEEPKISVADAVAHAYFRALEPAFQGDLTAAMYADLLHPRLWRGPRDQRIGRNGLVFVPLGRAVEYVRSSPLIEQWVAAQKQGAPLLWHHHAGRR